MKRPRWKIWWAVFTAANKEDVIRALENAGCEVGLGRSFTDTAKVYTEEQLINEIRDIDALMITSREEIISSRVIEAGRKLKTIAKMGIGVEQIDVGAATDFGILVTNTPIEENYLSVAEYTVGMMLSLAKNFKRADHNARLRKWRSVSNLLFKGKTVGIIGLGRIGSTVAKLLRPFRVKILAYDPYVSKEKAMSLGVQLTSLNDLLKESDFVSIHAVQTEETKRLIGEVELSMMKPSACLLNTARGALVDEQSLAKSLKEGSIAGAALDVFEPEIPDLSNPLLDESLYFRTLFSPHAASLNPETNQRMPLVQMENCLNALQGKVPEWVVNPEAVPKWRERMSREKGE